MNDLAAIHLDEEFRRLSPPLSPAERGHLERKLRREGCREPLILWAGTGILLAGYSTLEICRALDIVCPTEEKAFCDRNAARAWIAAEQLGRQKSRPGKERLWSTRTNHDTHR